MNHKILVKINEKVKVGPNVAPPEGDTSHDGMALLMW
jgi:hypothetical protein